MKWLDYRFGPKERSGDQGRIGEPMFCARQVLMLPSAFVYGLSLLVPGPLGAFIGAISCATIDIAWGMRPRWDFRDQMGLRR